jgi:hypothetical protein
MIMTPTLFLEAFGQLASDMAVIRAEEEDLYSVFRARAELMGWSSTDPHPTRLWGLEEAELTDGSASPRIGFVQIGMSEDAIEARRMWPPQASGFVPLPYRRRATVSPTGVLPAACQCFSDALHRFGHVTLVGMQATILNMDLPARSSADLLSGINWFRLTPTMRVTALIALDHALLGYDTDLLAASLQEWNLGAVTFGPLIPIPEPYQTQIPPAVSYDCGDLTPAHLGLVVTLPEWQASTVAWAIGLVVDTAREVVPDVHHCAVRVTRVPAQSISALAKMH